MESWTNKYQKCKRTSGGQNTNPSLNDAIYFELEVKAISLHAHPLIMETERKTIGNNMFAYSHREGGQWEWFTLCFKIYSFPRLACTHWIFRTEMWTIIIFVFCCCGKNKAMSLVRRPEPNKDEEKVFSLFSTMETMWNQFEVLFSCSRIGCHYAKNFHLSVFYVMFL